MTMADYEAVMQLLAATEGVRLREADSREATARYLERNPGLSFVAILDGKVAGCIMSGHDGRRGYLQHLAVWPQMRRRGAGAALAAACLAELEKLGIHKTHLDVLVENTAAQRFWQRRGWQKRDDILRYSFAKGSRPNA